MMTVVAMPYQVFVISHSSLAVGGLGLAQVVPLITMSLAGGAVADATDRKRLLLVINLLLAGCSSALTAATLLGVQSVPFLYVMAVLISGISAVDQPTRSALVPNMVPRRLLASALSLNSMASQLTRVIGPGVAGIIIAAGGTAPCYLIDAVTFVAAIWAAVAINGQPRPNEKPDRMLVAMARGLQFTWEKRILRSIFTLDAAAVIFGLKRALFPALATVVYGAGAPGVGLLYSAQAAGSLIAASTSGWIGSTRRQGWIMMIAVGSWALTILGLGFAPVLWLAALAVLASGIADGYSVVSRVTIVQTVTPDGLRGRINAIYTMSAASANSLSDVEAGGIATLTSPRFSIVSGGLVVLVCLGLLAMAFPDLRSYRARYLHEPEPLAEIDVSLAASSPS